jgi:uncharacterized phage infection (PIP) family protein YhgE
MRFPFCNIDVTKHKTVKSIVGDLVDIYNDKYNSLMKQGDKICFDPKYEHYVVNNYSINDKYISHIFDNIYEILNYVYKLDSIMKSLYDLVRSDNYRRDRTLYVCKIHSPVHNTYREKFIDNRIMRFIHDYKLGYIKYDLNQSQYTININGKLIDYIAEYLNIVDNICVIYNNIINIIDTNLQLAQLHKQNHDITSHMEKLHRKNDDLQSHIEELSNQLANTNQIIVGMIQHNAYMQLQLKHYINYTDSVEESPRGNFPL